MLLRKNQVIGKSLVQKQFLKFRKNYDKFQHEILRISSNLYAQNVFTSTEKTAPRFTFLQHKKEQIIISQYLDYYRCYNRCSDVSHYVFGVRELEKTVSTMSDQ